MRCPTPGPAAPVPFGLALTTALALMVSGCGVAPITTSDSPSLLVTSAPSPTTSSTVTWSAPPSSPVSASPSTCASPPEPSPSPTDFVGSGLLAPLYFHGSRHERTIAITIDDGFSSSAVLADLAILEAHHVNATWFPIGHVVASSPATWRTVAAAGYPIGNHTFDHSLLAGDSLSYITDDIKRYNAVVSPIVGTALVPLLRPPGGSWDENVLTGAEVAGERAVVLWDTTDGDAAPPPGSEDVRLLVHNATEGLPGSIILMHANLPYAQQALPQIITYYANAGFRFVTVGQMLGIPGPVPFASGIAVLSKGSAAPSPSTAPGSATPNDAGTGVASPTASPPRC